MKKVLSWMLGLGIVGDLAGCGGTDGTQPPEGSEGGGAGGDTLTVWAWDANFNVPIMEKAGQYYTEQVDGAPNMEVVEMANEDVMQRLISGFTSGVSEGLPDIVLMDDYDAQRMLTGYEGKFSELSEHIDMSQFADYKVDLVSHNDGVYVVPFDSGSAGLYYRTDYLEQAGYTQEDRQDLTWSEFVEIGKDVKEATGKWFLVFIPGRGTHYMQMAMQSAGLWYFDEKGNTNFDNPAIREMAPILKEIYENQLAMPVDYFSPEAVGAVTSGDVAAVNSAIWYSATIRSAEDQSGLWAYTNVPQLETVDNATPYTNLGGASWYVWEDSPNKEAAIELLETQFAENEEFYQEILVENGAVGTYIPAQGGEAFRSVMQQYMDG
ncbi:ABC transporter substrate-binding protein [Atopococcus tabaci]|uniref:ABC transporter substrate-binding protein n=1 Tax=Atopococcus tabaci TaxID=269774 RepID=UPI00240995AB|nr:extracellular solute-binding protein [Atopococcus tabaci]